MNELVIDTESTFKNKGGCFNYNNKLCLVGLQWLGTVPYALKVEYDSEPFGDNLRKLQEEIDKAELLILFNAKYDLHWLRRYGIRFTHRSIWDVQLAHFIQTGQEAPYPSLNGVSLHHNLGQKIDVVQEEYWNKGLDTDEVPIDILSSYCCVDVSLTGDCYKQQVLQLEGDSNLRILSLIRLAALDLLILEEIEWNGLIFDVEASKKQAEQIREEIASIDDALATLVGNIPVNWNSNDHCSAILYGGVVTSTTRVVDGVYKSGKKAGQPKFKIQHVEHKFDRIVNPVDRSELAKEGYWSTAEPILRQLKTYGKAKTIIEALLKRGKLEKAVSSYFEGLPELLAQNGWGTTIHGNLNQCVAATGRLSSSKPNLQNNPKEIDKLFISRYA